MMLDWTQVAATLRDYAKVRKIWCHGQEDGLRWLADRIEDEKSGLLIADEVGLGKTRLAVALIEAVTQAGGQVATVVPPTLLHQWESEHLLFLDALHGKGKGERRKPRRLRHFLDVFPWEEEESDPYPLAQNAAFLLISHGFSLSQGRGLNARILPAMVHGIMKHGKKWRDLPAMEEADGRIQQQRRAAVWLAEHAKDMRQALGGFLPPEQGWEEIPSLDDTQKTLFRGLLGRLFGQLDLVVIDEAHKSRENSEKRQPVKQLSCILEEMLSFAPGCRRIGLTATPVQLGTEDWRGILQRLNVESCEERLREIEAFDAVRAKFAASGPGDSADVAEICAAARRFQEALADTVVRRRWSDQPIMEQARAVFKTSGAHPHRRWDHHAARVGWADLSTEQRIVLLASEGRALASTGSALDMVERLRGDRHVQAMDIDFEPETEEEAPSDSDKKRRHTYWQRLQSESWPGGKELKENTLVVHPRILAACDWIEKVTENGDGKVLVFGSYNCAINALAQALNIRRFLREVAEAVPTRPPVSLRGGNAAAHPLLQAVLKGMPDRQKILASGDLAHLIEVSGKKYEDQSRRLGERIDKALRQAGEQDKHVHGIIRLFAIDALIRQPDQDDKALVKDLVSTVKRGAQAPEETEEEEQKTAQQGLLQEFEHAEERSRMSRSDFARVLKGDSQASTRHILQALFNAPKVRPHVLVAQERVASDGLNLHLACRHVLFLHLNWNPALIEQQIGRVDRVNSLWATSFAQEQLQPPPQIEIAAVVLDGTSDACKHDRILARQRLLSAHLFGELLPVEIMSGLKAEWRERIENASPSFSPPKRLARSKRTG